MLTEKNKKKSSNCHCKAKEAIATEKTYPAQLPLQLICVKSSLSCTSSLAGEAEHHFISKWSELAVA